MATEGVRIEGLRQVTRNLERLGVDVEDLKGAFSRIGSKAESHMQSIAPKRSGDLAGSIRQSKRKNSVYIYVGKKNTHRGRWSPYAPIVMFGWPGHNIEGNPFHERTVAVWGKWAVEQLEKELQVLVDKRGF